MDNQALLAIAIFLITYAFIISEKLHRTIVAMAGGLLMILTGIVTQEEGIHHIDFNTLGLLIGMMIIVSITAQTGVFTFVAIKAAKAVKGDPVKILIALSLITALASALLDNVTTVLLMVPITFSIARQLNVNPIPYLISEIICSNVGGAGTLIGDPPNIMIGSAVPELTFVAFLVHMAPVIAIILVVVIIYLLLVYRKGLKTTPELQQKLMLLDEKQELTNPTLLKKSLTVLTLTIIGFGLHGVFHLESATIALVGAFLLLLLTGEHYLEEALLKVEWNTIFFFAGLFVLVSGLVNTGVIASLAEKAIEFTQGDTMKTSLIILWMSGIASAFVDNIPFVATMIPMIKEMGSLGITNLEPLWWSLALGACLGGNGTIIGASANVIVVGMASKEKYPISFGMFFKVAFPITIITLLISHVYVYLRYFYFA
ncbi:MULTISPECIES: ArsB/NhaD family transporter [Brevibacillus]|uniref:ArsB/NhaD family transporter n=1 Tax=Brevibacillus laterosporus TaxID=1465 RepID=A0AAP3DG37_BRELA|nr:MULTISPECIES: ArsB/NhaD family transporter [Brevibacillus]MBG9786345.1 membrane protein [Brevibacillus laterosporus]MCG7318770.1 ArsB/NhaD family transporter [Brevibacillus laterosporus]MCR8979857.1 ArsB/NhaD family transporter [Brevibacillus laterosporus]MCZ0807012.1 ArsB/NhaD family transporter [Brevibacillus laterosporus]MCZ0827929.1 ArsB/NhaD family transporter [Brevibacillus laterosporus]